MQGDRAVAVGLSLTLHACLVGLVLSQIARVPNLAPRPPITVSFDAPPSVGESLAAALPQQVSPLAGSIALPTLAPVSIGSVSPTLALAQAAASALNDKGAALELRPPLSAAPPRATDISGTDLTALPLSMGQAIASTSPDVATKSLAAADQVSSAAMAADPLPASSVASELEAPAMIPTKQAAVEVQPAAIQSATLPPSQSPAIATVPELPSRLPDIQGRTAIEPSISALALPAQILADTAPPPAVAQAASGAAALVTVPSPLRASALPSIENAGPQSVPDVTQEVSARPRHVVEAPTPMTATEVPREAAIASLAPVEPGKAIDLDTTDIPVPPPDAERAQQIRAFVDRYDGGPCFFATVRQASASSAEIESFSTTPDAFRQLDRALKTSTGIEAMVSGQKIWSGQCPAVEYLRKLPHDAESAPTLTLDRNDINPGDVVSGSITGAAGRTLHLFVIAETGVVTDVSDAVSPHEGTQVFSFRPRHAAAGGPFPQILVLVAGAMTLPSHPANVGDIFEPLIAIRGNGSSFAAKMFLVTR